MMALTDLPEEVETAPSLDITHLERHKLLCVETVLGKFVFKLLDPTTGRIDIVNSPIDLQPYCARARTPLRIIGSDVRKFDWRRLLLIQGGMLVLSLDKARPVGRILHAWYVSEQQF